MKKLLLIATIVSMFTCCTQTETTPLEYPDARFEEVYRQTSFNGGVIILRDKVTNKEYLFVKEGYGAGLTNL